MRAPRWDRLVLSTWPKMEQALASIDDIRLRDWSPRSEVRLASTVVDTPSVPCIDAHNHLGRWLSREGEWVVPDPAALLEMMDSRHIEVIVNLDGRWGEELEANLDRYDRAYPDRFLTFCHPDWSLLGEPDGVERLVAQLHDSAHRGARGVKVWKDLGLEVRGTDGELVSPADPRVLTVLAHAGELGLPVLIHTADPAAFFAPLDEHNERLDELRGGGRGWLGDTHRHPRRDVLLEAHVALVTSTPQTTYIGAHVGGNAEDLDWVESLLTAAPNYNVDIAGRLGELGRQPRRFRRLVEAFPDRVLFGTDEYPPAPETYALHYRFLESGDEWFDYDPFAEVPPQGRWCISAAALDAHLLAGIYRENARRVLKL